MIKMNKIQKLIFAAAAMGVSLAVNAQFDDRTQAGIQSVKKAGDSIKNYFEPVVYVMYAVSAILGIIGGIKVYSKWQSGDPDTGKTAASWFGSCIFLVLVAAILNAFFLS